MVVRQETRPGAGASSQPEEFRVAAASMRKAKLRPEVLCEEMPAPQRIAPYATALSADVTVDGTDVGTGRIILLHDPASIFNFADNTVIIPVAVIEEIDRFKRE